VAEAVIASDAGSIAEFVRSRAPKAEMIGLESGPTSPWLWHALRAEGLPVVVIDARHAKAVLSLRINKTDRNDAVGLAELLVSGWYKRVTAKSLDSHRVRTVLNNRALLVGIRQDLENQEAAPAVYRMPKARGFARGHHLDARRARRRERIGYGSPHDCLGENIASILSLRSRRTATTRAEFDSSYSRSRISRTFLAKAFNVNGFCRKFTLACRTPCRTTASSV
jgi:hypothetical protein